MTAQFKHTFSDDRDRYGYQWPAEPLDGGRGWAPGNSGSWCVRELPESKEALARNSRWPMLFPCPICIVTVTVNGETFTEKVVGPSIVNRFPYVMALSFCTSPLSDRHYARRRFVKALEQAGEAAVQFLPLGDELDAVMTSISTVPDEHAERRLSEAGVELRDSASIGARVIASSYLVYEGRLVRPGKDFDGEPIFPLPSHEIGSHTIYFLEITTIALRTDIAEGRARIDWRSLPTWSPDLPAPKIEQSDSLEQEMAKRTSYVKGYRANYEFPSANTIAFQADGKMHDMSLRKLPPLPEDQVEVDNDAARWPCFFPSTVGMVVTEDEDGINCMPCGSTTIVARSPLIVAPSISYSRINERYAPRRSLDRLRRSGRFVCSVPYVDQSVMRAIAYLGNVSFVADHDKIETSGMQIERVGSTPVLKHLPIHLDCRIVDSIRLGTHEMFLGEVERIVVYGGLSPQTPLTWCPWPTVTEAQNG